MRKKLWPEILFVTVLLACHLVLLLVTKFRDWPDMITYPWLISRDFELYKDIVYCYTPGTPLILNLFYRLLGYSLFSLRIIDYLLIFAADIILYSISRKIFRGIAAALVVLGFFILWHIPFEGNSIWYENVYIPTFLISVYLFLKYIKRNNRKYLFLSGVIMGMTFLVKQSVIWPIIAAVVYLAAENIRDLKNGIVKIAFYIVPTLAIFGISAVYYFFRGTADPYLFWTITYNNPSYTNLMPFSVFRPSLSQLLYIAPAYSGIVFCILIAVSAFYRHRYVYRLGLFLILIAVATPLSSLPHFGILKLQTSLTVAALAAGFVWENRRLIMTGRKVRLITYLVLIVGIFGSFRSQYRYYSRMEPAVTSYFNAGFFQMADEVRSVIGNRDYFIFGNYDYLYFVLNRTPTVLPYTFQQPWFLEVPGLQDQIIRSLESQKTPIVLYFPFHRGKLFYDDYIPEKLYNFIMDHYYPVKNLTGYGWILERNSDAM